MAKLTRDRFDSLELAVGLYWSILTLECTLEPDSSNETLPCIDIYSKTIFIRSVMCLEFERNRPKFWKGSCHTENVCTLKLIYIECANFQCLCNPAIPSPSPRMHMLRTLTHRHAIEVCFLQIPLHNASNQMISIPIGKILQ